MHGLVYRLRVDIICCNVFLPALHLRNVSPVFGQSIDHETSPSDSACGGWAAKRGLLGADGHVCSLALLLALKAHAPSTSLSLHYRVDDAAAIL